MITQDIFEIRKDYPNGDYLRVRVGQRLHTPAGDIVITDIFFDNNGFVSTGDKNYKIMAENEEVEFLWRQFSSNDVTVTCFIPNFTAAEMLKTIIADNESSRN